MASISISPWKRITLERLMIVLLGPHEPDGKVFGDGGEWIAGGGNPAWDDITGKPSTFPPTLPIAESGVTDLVTDLAAKESANANIHTHVTGTGSPHTSAGVGAEAAGAVATHAAVPAPHSGHVQVAGQIGGSASSPDVRGVRETGGPTLLTMGAVADGQYQ